MVFFHVFPSLLSVFVGVSDVCAVRCLKEIATNMTFFFEVKVELCKASLS